MSSKVNAEALLSFRCFALIDYIPILHCEGELCVLGIAVI